MITLLKTCLGFDDNKTTSKKEEIIWRQYETQDEDEDLDYIVNIFVSVSLSLIYFFQ